MVSTTEVIQKISPQEMAIKWIDEALGRGDSLTDAVMVVVERICTDGLAETLMRENGHQLIRTMWEDHNRKRRARIIRSGNGRRRINTNLLSTEAASLETLWHVEGDYYRLGDMDKARCKAASQEYCIRAAGNMQVARFFGTIAAKLKRDQIVRERFADEELAALFQESAKS